MNETNPTRQLSRRELRELAAQQAAKTVSEASEFSDTETATFSVSTDEGYNAAQLAVVAELTAAVNVSWVAPDGKEMTRREVRLARAQEYARLLAEWEKENGPLGEFGVDKPQPDEPVADTEAEIAEVDSTSATDKPVFEKDFAGQEVPAELSPEVLAVTEFMASAEPKPVAVKGSASALKSVEQSFETAAESAPEAAGAAVNVQHQAELAATQALNLEELAAAEGKSAFDEAINAELTAETPESLEATEQQRKRRWGVWGKKDKESFAHTANEAATDEDAVAVEVDLVADPAPAVPVYAAGDDELVVPAVEDSQLAAEAEIAAEIDAKSAAVAASEAADDTQVKPVSASRVQYSFPDIVPLAEESVFDAGSTRQMVPDNAFDALINRAVEEETSATVTTGTAALILPSMPEEAVLAAALDEDNGVFVSGSIQLPQSVGETGGHHSLHGSEAGEQEVLDEIFETNSHTQPVSALKAVSSQHAQMTNMLGETKKDDSKMPLIFAITGGSLVIAAIAVVIAAINGVFG